MKNQVKLNFVQLINQIYIRLESYPVELN